MFTKKQLDHKWMKRMNEKIIRGKINELWLSLSYNSASVDNSLPYRSIYCKEECTFSIGDNMVYLNLDIS